jgi:hypothetical protein
MSVTNVSILGTLADKMLSFVDQGFEKLIAIQLKYITLFFLGGGGSGVVIL